MPRMMSQELRPETLCVQAGWAPKKGEPRVLPIYQSTTFKYETSEQMAKLFDLEEAGFFYTRLQNPTNEAVARKIAELEGGRGRHSDVFRPGGFLLCRFQYLRGWGSYRQCFGDLRGHIQPLCRHIPENGH